MKRAVSLLLTLALCFSLALMPHAAASAGLPAGVSKLTVSTAGQKKQLQLKWKRQTDADGYQIYRSETGKSGSYRKIATLRPASKNAFTDAGLKSAKTYYYAVRAFRNVDGKNRFGKFAKADLSTKLTKTAIQKKLVAANRFYIGWVLHCFEASECEDPRDTRPISGDPYGFYYIRIRSNKYKCVADLKKEAAKYFTKAVYEDEINDGYADIDGKLYRKSYDLGGDGGTEQGALKILSQTDTGCKIRVTSQYSDSEGVYTYRDDYKMVYRNGRWLFANMTDSFGIYFHGSEFWK